MKNIMIKYNYRYNSKSKNLLSITNINKKLYSFGFKSRTIESNYYDILNVPYNSDIDTIKKKYFKLAKKYHPDMNKEPGSEEMFKTIKKAYEVIGDPNRRIIYDIDMNFQNDESKYVKRSSSYEVRYNVGPKTIKNYYYNKWTDFKTPKWSNLYSGMDIKSEYINRKEDNDIHSSYLCNRIYNQIVKYRLFFYLMFVISLDLYMLIDNYSNIKYYYLYREILLKAKLIK